MESLNTPNHQQAALAPTVPITLDRRRSLLMNFNAIAYLEVARNRSVFDASTWKNLSAKDMRHMLFAALQHEDPDLTLQQVGKMIHSGNLEEVMRAVSEAWKVSAGGTESGQILPLEISPATKN